MSVCTTKTITKDAAKGFVTLQVERLEMPSQRIAQVNKDIRVHHYKRGNLRLGFRQSSARFNIILLG